MKIIVCSSSTLKQEAVLDAVKRLDLSPNIQALKTFSGVPDQPLGDYQTLLGALQRAGSGLPNHYVIAIENGVVARGAGFVDLAYVVVVSPSGHIVVRSSRTVPVPIELVTAARSSALKTTCGQLEAARTTDYDPADPHIVWSGGATSRRELLAATVEEALRAALHMEASL